MKTFGRYQVVERNNKEVLIGRGGQGVVYLAYDPRLRREVAIKVITVGFLSDKDQSRERFEREAAVMAGLAHPGIVPIYDFGEQDGSPYFVMRFMRGGSLRDRLNERKKEQKKQQGTFSVQEVAELFERLAPGLDMAHGLGIIHRDLKPGNILLDAFGNPFIADFGLAKVLNVSMPIQSAKGAGTPHYTSPEQGRGLADTDQRTDVYALGVMAFELLTGKWPYESENAVGFAYQHNFKAIPNICQINPNLPAECQPIIERVLAKQPKDRYNSVGELAEALKKLTQSDPVEYLKRGHEFYKQKEYDLAIAEYTKALHEKAACSVAYLNRGHAYYRKAEYGLAIADYDQTLRLTPDYAAAYYWRGNAKQQRSQSEPSFSFTRIFFFKKSKAQQERSRFEQAIRDYDAALRIDPNYVDAYFQRGLAHQGTGRLDLAIADYDAALRLNPNYHQAKTAAEAAKKQQEAADKALLNNEAQLKALPAARKVALYVRTFKSEPLLRALSVKRRVAIGRELAKLGDLRPEAMTINGMQFCWVPAGWFWMGSDDAGNDDNKPRHRVYLPYGYWIARYPVTNAQFQVFVEEKGYGNPAYWTEAKAQGYWENGKIKDWLDDTWRDAPRDWGTPYTLPNHPRVGINWYEALAFTRWLSITRQWSGARLLSEAEWEKAARGGEEIPATPLIRPATAPELVEGVVPSAITMIPNPSPQRHFPWGDDFDAALTNSKESAIGHPNAVGAFGMGKSPYGTEEMSGNVWEWCQSQWKSYDYSPNDGQEKLDVYAPRAFRGGSYYTNFFSVTCNFRYWSYPNFRNDALGFRVLRPPHI